MKDCPRPPDALKAPAVGRQWWWELRYSDLGIVTASELHVPVSESGRRQIISPTLESDAFDEPWDAGGRRRAEHPEKPRAWVENPQTIKEGCLMPDMQLSDQELDQIVAYLLTLK